MYSTAIGFSDHETLKIALSPKIYLEIYRENNERNSFEPIVIICNQDKKAEFFVANSKYDVLLDICRNGNLKDYISQKDYENEIANQSHLGYFNYKEYLNGVKYDIIEYIEKRS